jgi:glycosyltransferase A (GT-A) superfamily protein (DUF2064 family)
MPALVGRREMAGIVVALLAKAPRAGEVKTRLCPPLSAKEAADLYRCFLLDKIAQVKALRETSPAIAYTPAEGRIVFEELAPGFALVLQRGRVEHGRRSSGDDPAGRGEGTARGVPAPMVRRRHPG